MNINLFDVLTGGAKFEAGRALVDVDLPATVDDLTDARLLTLGLDLDEEVGVTDETYFLRVGPEGFALEIEDGSLGVAVISAPAPTTPATDTRRWVAVEASGLSGSLGLGSAFTAEASAIEVLVNRASGAYDADGVAGGEIDAAEIDWTSALDLDQDGTFGETGEDDVVVGGHTIDRTGAGFSIEGTIDTIDILGFVTGTAHFAIGKDFVNVRSSGGPDASGATLLAVELTDVGLTVGEAGGPTFAVTDGSLFVAAIKPAAPTGPATDERAWLVVKGGLTATFDGIDGLELTVTGLNVEINHATGAYDADGNGSAEAPQQATALDWDDNLDLDGDLVFGESGDDDVDPSGPIDYPGALVRASGTASVNIFDFVSGSVSFTYEQQLVDVDADGDGTFDPSAALPSTPIRGPPDLDNATLTLFALRILAPGILIGVPGGAGITIPSGTLAVATLTPASGSSGDTRSWLALKTQIDGGAFDGITGVEFSATNLTVEINRASGAFDPTPSSPASGDEFGALELDWTDAIDVDESAATFDADDISIDVDDGARRHRHARVRLRGLLLPRRGRPGGRHLRVRGRRRALRCHQVRDVRDRRRRDADRRLGARVHLAVATRRRRLGVRRGRRGRRS